MEKLYRVQMNKNGMPNFSTALEVKPKRGEWVKEIDTMSGSKDYAPINYYCSECGEFSPTVLNFCPNCGAKMKGADDDSKRD